MHADTGYGKGTALASLAGLVGRLHWYTTAETVSNRLPAADGQSLLDAFNGRPPDRPVESLSRLLNRPFGLWHSSPEYAVQPGSDRVERRWKGDRPWGILGHEAETMEYVIAANRPFADIEAETVAALEQRGVLVRRTFSLSSAAGGRDSKGGRTPGYSVLMLYASRDQPQPLGLVTLYERGGRTVIKPVLTSLASRDVNAELVTALVLGGLEFCVNRAGGRNCLDPQSADTAGLNSLQKETE